ncbi:hypothetical protein WMC41_09550 [Shinella yambaruensis]|uniref:hypothetical protein n=1 Tax=Shinella yambaruensis TaxID=415996 RepID=UPI003D7A02EF
MVSSGRLHPLYTAVLTAALAVTGVSDGYGQSTDPSPRGSSNSQAEGAATPSDFITNAILANLAAARSECGSYDRIYRVDCLRHRLLDISRRIPEGPAYGQARQIVGRAASRLGSIQSANADTRVPKQRSRRNPRLREAKVYTAIKREKLNQAMQQASRVIEEAATQLLRAGENSEKRSAHYQKIAAAVGSTKVLLRSA